MVSISGRSKLLLILVLLFSFTCVFAVGDDDDADEEVIAFKRLRGIPNSQAGLERVLGLDEQEVVGPSWRSVQRSSDLKFNNQHLDHSEVKPGAEKTWAVVRKKAEVTGTVEDNTTTTKATPANNSSTSASPPVLSPKESKNSTAKLPPAANATSVSPSPANSTGGEKKPPRTHGETCDHGPVIGTLAPAGEENGHQHYTLTVENAGKSNLNVTIVTLPGWKVTPGELTLSKGHKKSVKVSVTDNQVTKHESKITLTWTNGDCFVDVPAQNNLVGNVDHSSYLAFLTAPGTAALLLGGSLVFLLVLGVAGVWGCISWRARARRHGDTDTKYQELEMALPSTDAKQQGGGDDEESPSAEGWDEVWEDDDWQDNEAVRASSTALALSSAGLNARRANKDGWDSTWDD